jgi:hypothetical protein
MVAVDPVLPEVEENPLVSTLLSSVVVAPLATDSYRTPAVANKLPSQVTTNTHVSNATSASTPGNVDMSRSMSFEEESVHGDTSDDEAELAIFAGGLRNRERNEKE